MSRYRGPSEAQINAEALARRGSPYSEASAASFTWSYDYHNRVPSDLREGEYLCRKAYADEVPDKLHDGPDAIGPDGTPRMSNRAEHYIFGDLQADDAGRDPETKVRDLVGYHFTPFRAALDRLEKGSESERKRAAIVSHVTIGSQSGVAAAIAEGVPSWCAYIVAEHALRDFLRNMSDLKVHLPKETQAA